jgi:hypothetical protein
VTHHVISFCQLPHDQTFDRLRFSRPRSSIKASLPRMDQSAHIGRAIVVREFAALLPGMTQVFSARQPADRRRLFPEAPAVRRRAKHGKETVSFTSPAQPFGRCAASEPRANGSITTRPRSPGTGARVKFPDQERSLCPGMPLR